MEDKIVYIVHAVDTEGPLFESVEASFERLNELLGHSIEPSAENLRKLQHKELDLNGDEEKAQDIFSKVRIESHGDWGQIDAMLDEITSDSFRTNVKDSFGEGWVYSWFCLDHVGITGINPRKRDLGHHKVLDHYSAYFKRKQDERDLLQWHYHALSITNDAHRAGSAYLNSDHIYSILTRKVIDRHWFPAAFRPGHHTERPDANFFLEQWIPFDFGNDSTMKEKAHLDVSAARYGDWRRAPKSWIPYHPSHDDYQVPGTCRRFIARCLPIAERGYLTSFEDVSQAFDEARERGSSILGVTNHDFRDMKPDVEKMMGLISECADKYRDIKFKYSNAIEAMRATLGLNDLSEIGFHVELKEFKTHTRLIVESSNNIFGPQPFLALKTKEGSFFWQNFDFEGPNLWLYSFDSNNILIEEVSQVGVAANTKCGLTEVFNIDVENKVQRKNVINNGNVVGVSYAQR